jgi:hypothetical protein
MGDYARIEGMTMTRKRAYLTLLMAQPSEWIAAIAASPSPAMTRTHVALCLIELRRRAGRPYDGQQTAKR